LSLEDKLPAIATRKKTISKQNTISASSDAKNILKKPRID
jgi:hypothetical protein